MYTSSSSYDDRPFASGVVTTQTNDSFDMNVVKIHSSDESSYDLTMDKTQSASPADIPERFNLSNNSSVDLFLISLTSIEIDFFKKIK
uniref:MARVEL domain-containing protein n=1 Tax=Caenorhabditis tropicalis TaxID=1561998 RepID=A0A1I7T0T6_9PELO